MFTRFVTYTGVSDIDAGARYISETAAPLMRQQNGYSGGIVSADRSAGILGVLSIWATEDDRDASDGAFSKVRDEILETIGGEATVEYFEQAVVAMVARPTVGSSLLLRRISMDPAKVADNLDYFRQEVLPQMTAQPGCLTVRHMINRETGEGLVGTSWTDEASMLAAAEEADKRRQLATDRGVIFGKQSRREIVFVDLP